MGFAEDAVKRILRALVYLEEQGDVSCEALAKVACYSPYHFHRVFQAVIGQPVSQYVRRLKFEKAATRLAYSSASITLIALDADYDTPSAFTKAFKQLMGQTPSHYRRCHRAAVEQLIQKVKGYPMIQPDQIEHLPDLSLLFVRKCDSAVRGVASAASLPRAKQDR